MSVNVFLDRDGTLIEDVGYIASPDHVLPLPGVFEGLQLLKQNNYHLHIVSNQSGLARGKFSSEEFDEVEVRFKQVFLKEGIIFDSLNYCFHSPTEGCTCRKPKPGLFEQVSLVTQIDRRLSGMIGNSDVDRGAADAFGIPYWDVNVLIGDDLTRSAFEAVSYNVIEYFEGVLSELG